MMMDNCVRCNCPMFESKGDCNCLCHPALNRLLEMNHGDREKTRRDLLEEVNNPTPMSEVVKMLKSISNNNPFQEIKVGTAIEGKDTSEMSTGDFIDYEIYLGIQKGALDNGFVIDRLSKTELMRVLDKVKLEERVPMCISYLTGYDRGFKFSKLQRDSS